MSHWFYIHKDLNNTPNVHKIGITMAPYSAVRARQKFCWQQFGLQHLYFGGSSSIQNLEKDVKKQFLKCSGRLKNGFGTQTELFEVDINTLLRFIEKDIIDSQLNIVKVKLDSDYTASNSSSCPLGVPPEKYASKWADRKFNEIFSKLIDGNDRGILGKKLVNYEMFEKFFKFD